PDAPNSPPPSVTVQSPPRASSADESPDPHEHRRNTAGAQESNGQLDASVAPDPEFASPRASMRSARDPRLMVLDRSSTVPHGSAARPRRSGASRTLFRS